MALASRMHFWHGGMSYPMEYAKHSNQWIRTMEGVLVRPARTLPSTREPAILPPTVSFEQWLPWLGWPCALACFLMLVVLQWKRRAEKLRSHGRNLELLFIPQGRRPTGRQRRHA